ncbi:MAG: hypothetical protein K0R40_1774 [Burkholderiales bacterium]|nr:hypothetical protein [Burkholderiales bacterium]
MGAALFVSYPLTVHFATPTAALALLAALAAFLAASFFVRHAARWLLPPLAGVAVFLASPPAHWLLYVPPVLINLCLCWVFGRTLVRGRTPLIARFAMLEQGELTAELAGYTRVLTWLWTLLFAGAAIASAALALSGERDAWSFFTNFLNYALVAALFLGEFAYRRVRYRAYRHASPLKLARNVRKAGLYER